MRAWRYVFLLLAFPVAVNAGPLTVAVASNFQTAARDLARAFERNTGYAVRVSAGSTGKLYGQIVNGAPFDVFLAADVERPARLERTGHGSPGTRVTYAIGSLVLWSRDGAVQGPDCRDELTKLDGRRLAIANPETAPYGRAAVEFLTAAGVWDTVKSSLVIGENVSQAMQFAATGNARLGLVAASQVENPELPPATCAWPVPHELHRPIAQQAVALSRADDPEAALKFMDFLVSDEARTIIIDSGYRVPEVKR